LLNHLRHQLERVGNTRDKAELAEVGGIVFMVQLRICHQIPRRGGTLQGRHQRGGPLLENLRIRGIPIPTFAHKGHAAVLRDHQCQHGLFHVRPVVFRVAMGESNGVLVAVGHIVATAGQDGRVEMMEAEVDTFLRTDGHGQFAQH